MLKVYQIYYKPEQLTAVEYTPYLNRDCTEYFENSVIRTLVENNQHLDCEYFGVISYKLRQKIQIAKTDWSSIPNIANQSDQPFTPESFQNLLFENKPDIMSFQRHPGHDPVSFADNFHKNFSKYFSAIMKKIGYDWKPEVFSNVFYCNFFVAKPDIYEKYVREMLIPAMRVMSEMPELWANSGYPHPLPLELVQKWNVKGYPYHTFLCERMFSYFVHLNKYKCLHY